MEINRIMRYLKGTQEYGLWYKLGDNMDLKVFTDADWVGSIDDRKSISGGAFFLGKRLVSWTSKTQNCTSQSIVEVEYVVAVVNCSNIVCFEQLLVGMKVEIKDPVVIYYDNTSQIKESSNALQNKAHCDKISLPKRFGAR